MTWATSDNGAHWDTFKRVAPTADTRVPLRQDTRIMHTVALVGTSVTFAVTAKVATELVATVATVGARLGVWAGRYCSGHVGLQLKEVQVSVLSMGGALALNSRGNGRVIADRTTSCRLKPLVRVVVHPATPVMQCW